MYSNPPKYVREIENNLDLKLSLIKKNESELLESQQKYKDGILEIFREAFDILIEKTVTCSKLLRTIKSTYENAIEIRDKRITQFIVLDNIFGITVKKNERDSQINDMIKEINELKEDNLKLTSQLAELNENITKMQNEKTADDLILMRERDERNTLEQENIELRNKLNDFESSGAPSVSDVFNDPFILRIALDRCRKQLSRIQECYVKMSDEYSDTVPRNEFDALESKYSDLTKLIEVKEKDKEVLQHKYNRLQALKKSTDTELNEVKDRCGELERAGTPRPHWEICSDFIGGGKDRWCQLANGLSSRDKLRVLLKELGPAAESDILEHFDGLGTDPVIPPYLRYEGKVRNLRLSRREISVIINDMWLGKLENGRSISMQDYVTKYFEDRYQQPSVRAEWAYNLCSGAEQMLDEPQVKLFWGVLHGHLSEDIYWGLRAEWQTLKDNLYRHSKDDETITLEEFEKISKSTFPLKSEVDIKNLSDVVKKQLKLKLNQNEINLDKLFLENEEGIDRVEFARELYRQRQVAQDKYIREIVAELGGKNAPKKMISVENLKRAFAIVDPAIDHIRMDRNIRWAFFDSKSDLSTLAPLPLRTLAVRLAAGDIERVGPRCKGAKRRIYK